MTLHLLLYLLFFAAAPTTEAPATGEIAQPDLNGTWSGKLYQNAGGIAPEFEFTMEIMQNGVFVRGKSYVKHGDIWAEMAFSGHQSANGTLVLTETSVLRAKKPDDLSWCMKQFELQAQFAPDGTVLTGPWWGDSAYGPCVPGSVRLFKRTKTA